MSRPTECVNAYLQGSKVKILRRTPGGELVSSMVPAEYSFFVKKEDVGSIEGFRRQRVLREEGDYVRMICQSWDERNRIVNEKLKRENVLTYEADLSPVRRFMIDSGIKIQKPKPGFMDLEADSRVPFTRFGEARCLCWSLVTIGPDGELEKRGGVLAEDTDEAERELLLDFFYELTFVDQVLAWNGDRYDFPYLAARVEKLGLQIDLKRWLWLDHMELFSKWNLVASDSGDEKASMALDRVAASLGVAGKLRRTGYGELKGVKVGGGKSWEYWVSGGANRELLLEYCVEDACTMTRVDKEKPYVDLLAILSETTGVFADSRGFRGVNFVETYLMRLGAERGARAPSKLYNEGENYGDREQFKGAYVFPTKKGVFFDVHVCDFARLYPSIMQAWNMSPETWLGSAGTEGEHALEDANAALKPGEAVTPVTLQKFRVDGPRGLFALALDTVVEQRKYWQKKKTEYEKTDPMWKFCDNKDQAYKIIANTFYGVVGSVFSRFFLKEVAESVTQIGAWLIKMTAKESGLTIVAGDTDSGFFQGCTKDEFAAFVERCNKEIYPMAVMPTGANEKFISLAFEKSFSIMLSIVKKNYAGRMSHFKGKNVPDDAKPIIKGLEYKRGDSTKLARDMQEEVVEKILMIGEPLPKNYSMPPSAIEEIVSRWQDKIMKMDFPMEEAVFAQRLSKNPESYGGTRPDGQAVPIPAHVRVANELKARGLPIYAGVKVEYVVTDGSKSPQKVKPAIDATKDDVDRYHLWESEIWPATERVVQACYPNHDWRRWGSVRPKKGVLPGQTGFGFGERRYFS